MSQEFRMKNIDETRSYFFEKISKKNWWVGSIERFVQI